VNVHRSALDLHPFQQIDRTISGEGFVDPDVSNFIQQLQAALNEPVPLSFHIAQQLRQLKRRTAALFTGFCHTELLPHGENDGPLGTLALARSLDRCGLIPTIWVDPQLLDNVRWLQAELGIDLPIHAIDLEVLEAATVPPAVAIAIEKPGQNSQGVMHTFDGLAIEGGSVAIDSFFSNCLATETVTLGIGDRGNEIGFGRLRETVAHLLPSSTSCQCGCGGGVIASTSTQLFLPAAVSNWGAYGIAAALAILEGNEALLHLPSEEERLLQVAAVRGCVDGVMRRGVFGVDGLSGETSVSIVRQLQRIVQQALQIDT